MESQIRQFLSRMSHDMRTPLNAIINLTSPEMLEDADEEQKKEYLEQIHASGTYLLGIVDDMMDMFSMNSDKITLDTESYCMDDFKKMVSAVMDENPEENSKENLEENSKENILEGKHILLFEDYSVNAKITKKLLARKGCIVDHAMDGIEGLEMFEKSDVGYYDAILMDIRMPRMDGLEATRNIRALKRKDAEETPIIAMTANTYTDDVRSAIEAGMDTHLGKPVEPQILYGTLEQYMSEE